MKRFVFLFLCVAIVVCLLTAPALAGKKAPTLRLPENAATVWDGWWFEASGGDAGTWWMCNDPTWPGGEPPWPDYKPVSREQPIYHFAMWVGVGYGYALNTPKTVSMTVDVYGPDDPDKLYQHFSAKQVRAYWTGPYVWDAFWTGFWEGMWIDPWEPAPFNPRIGAGVYGNNLMLPLGPFEKPGHYYVTHTWKTLRPVTEKLYFGDPARPVHSAAGAQYGTFPFDMYVE